MGCGIPIAAPPGGGSPEPMNAFADGGSPEPMNAPADGGSPEPVCTSSAAHPRLYVSRHLLRRLQRLRRWTPMITQNTPIAFNARTVVRVSVPHGNVQPAERVSTYVQPAHWSHGGWRCLASTSTATSTLSHPRLITVMPGGPPEDRPV